MIRKLFKRFIEKPVVEPQVSVNMTDETHYAAPKGFTTIGIIGSSAGGPQNKPVYIGPSIAKVRWWQVHRWWLIPRYKREMENAKKQLLELFGHPQKVPRHQAALAAFNLMYGNPYAKILAVQVVPEDAEPGTHGFGKFPCSGTFQLGDLVKVGEAGTDEFGINDIVRLNSGGPEMKVVNVKGCTAICEWDCEGRKYQRPFPFAALDLVERNMQ